MSKDAWWRQVWDACVAVLVLLVLVVGQLLAAAVALAFYVGATMLVCGLFVLVMGAITGSDYGVSTGLQAAGIGLGATVLGGIGMSLFVGQRD
jgi:hypothetical protein